MLGRPRSTSGSPALCDRAARCLRRATAIALLRNSTKRSSYIAASA
jgi:hypothetical protein